jgi:hypothetical protein
MKAFLASLAVSLLVLVGLASATVAQATTQPTPTPTATATPTDNLDSYPAPSATPNTPCTEEMACWDCTTMGNNWCGAMPENLGTIEAFALYTELNPQLTENERSWNFYTTYLGPAPIISELNAGQTAIPSRNNPTFHYVFRPPFQ